MEFMQTFHSSGHGLMKPSEQKEEQRSVHDINHNKYMRVHDEVSLLAAM